MTLPNPNHFKQQPTGRATAPVINPVTHDNIMAQGTNIVEFTNKELTYIEDSLITKANECFGRGNEEVEGEDPKTKEYRQEYWKAEAFFHLDIWSKVRKALHQTQ